MARAVVVRQGWTLGGERWGGGALMGRCATAPSARESEREKGKEEKGPWAGRGGTGLGAPAGPALLLWVGITQLKAQGPSRTCNESKEEEEEGVTRWGTLMNGNVTALEGLHVTGKYRDGSMQHTCSRHAAWDPHTCGA